MNAVRFDATAAEYDLIAAIADRATDMALTGSVIDVEMDIAATHANGCPLDLERLLAFPPFDFAHDVLGIRQHIDRSTGKLGDCFVPRSARMQS